MYTNFTKTNQAPTFAEGQKVWQAGEIGGSRVQETVKDVRHQVENGVVVERFNTVESAAWRMVGGWSLVSKGSYSFDFGY